MGFDQNSFLIGVQVGRRIRLWDATVSRKPPVPPRRYILTERGEKIVTEAEVSVSSKPLVTEES